MVNRTVLELKVFMKQRKRVWRQVDIVWLWLLLACAATALTFASQSVIAAAPAPSAEEDFVPSETLAADSAVAFPVDI